MKYWQVVKAFEEGKDVEWEEDIWNNRSDKMENFLRDLAGTIEINEVKILPTKEEKAKEVHNQLIEFYYTEEEEKAIELIKKLL